MVSNEKIAELKQLYFKKYKVLLTDEEAVEMATALVNLMKILIKPETKLEPKESDKEERKQGETIRV